MPRQARLDAPGTLHHVMARGIEGTNIFRTDKDREDFLDRLAVQCEAEVLKIYAWALIPNHFHLLVRTGSRPLFASMRKILTGYVARFNRRHRRQGDLFHRRRDVLDRMPSRERGSPGQQSPPLLRETPERELRVARRRMKEVQNG